MVVLICTLAVGAVGAELIVIYDSGRTRPISEFLGPLTKNSPSNNNQTAATALLGTTAAANLLPIRSPCLSPGDVIRRSHSLPFAKVFFLVGSDVRSQRWLRRHREQLQKMDAVGLLVQAASIEDLERMADITAGLPMTPASGSDIAKALGVRHYPFAISDGYIWQ